MGEFTALKTVSKRELTTLKVNNAAYAALLNTSHGRSFESDVGNADIIKLYATLASPQASGVLRAALPLPPDLAYQEHHAAYDDYADEGYRPID